MSSSLRFVPFHPSSYSCCFWSLMCPNIVSSFSLIILFCLKLFSNDYVTLPNIIVIIIILSNHQLSWCYNRIYRRLCAAALVQIPAEIARVLKGIDNWSYDVFSLGVASNGQVLKYLGYDLLNRYGFIHKFKVRRSSSFLLCVLVVLFIASNDTYRFTMTSCPYVTPYVSIFLVTLFALMLILSLLHRHKLARVKVSFDNRLIMQSFSDRVFHWCFYSHLSLSRRHPLFLSSRICLSSRNFVSFFALVLVVFLWNFLHSMLDSIVVCFCRMLFFPVSSFGWNFPVTLVCLLFSSHFHSFFHLYLSHD